MCFCVGQRVLRHGRRFASVRHSVKCTPEVFAELTERPGIIPAHYVARYHWITIEDIGAVTATELKDLIKQSYQLVFDKLPTKLKRTIQEAG